MPLVHLDAANARPAMSTTPVLSSPSSEVTLQQFMEHSDDVFWLADLRTGSLLYVSPKVSQLWGVDAEALVHTPSLWNKAVDPLDTHLLPEPFFADKTGVERPVREYRVTDPHGKVHWIRDRRFYLHDHGGQLTRVGGIAEDVTERKRHEDRQDEFLSIVTHELRSPLNAMRGWTHVLRRAGALNPLQEKALEAIDRSSQTQARLMDELLDQQRILQGEVELQWARTDLPALLDETVGSAQVQAGARGIRLELRQERSIGLISADTHRLRQVLTILLNQVVRLTPEQGHIAVSTRPAAHAFFIELHGSGDHMAPEDLPSARLGLHLAKQMISLHGGELVIRHQGEGQGTTFSIQLPDKLRLAYTTPLPELATNTHG